MSDISLYQLKKTNSEHFDVPPIPLAAAEELAKAISKGSEKHSPKTALIYVEDSENCVAIGHQGKLYVPSHAV